MAIRRAQIRVKLADLAAVAPKRRAFGPLSNGGNFFYAREISLEGGFVSEGRWCALQVSNLRPLPCEGNALPLS